ncbi:MAG: hypothetical protein EHM42_04900 [Planctomycetaceae bacterium]|nr:MAG: hypothetical protein EHM42_04900 [Planctomycetaceae bacterium]
MWSFAAAPGLRAREEPGATGGVGLEEMTGAHSRLVWVQDQSDAQTDTLARGKKLRLMGIDSRDGRGERALRGSIQNYAKPLLTPDGSQVVYSDHFADKVFVVDWESGRQREVCDGFALDVWADPVSGTTWVYTASRANPRENYIYRGVRRVRLDQPKVVEPVWDKTLVGPDNFQLSADGLHAAGEFPWPDAGVADLARQDWEKRATGCWASLAPDNSGLSAVFDGPHRNWQLQARSNSRRWSVALNQAPGIDNHEVFHPRWSNHVSHVVMTGPYAIQGTVNVISGGGPGVEVYVGRLSNDFQRIESWRQITANRRGDFHPDLWVAGGEHSSVPASVVGTPELAERPRWPAAPERCVYLWRDSRSQNEVRDAKGAIQNCGVEARGAAHFDRRFAMFCRGGWFEAAGGAPQALERCAAGNAYSLELLMTPDSVARTANGPIMAIVDSAGLPQLVIEQEGAQVYVRASGPSTGRPIRLLLGTLSSSRPHHLALTVESGKPRAWWDGSPVRLGRTRLPSSRPWRDGSLRFGSTGTTTNHWHGRIERVFLSDNALDSATVTADHRLIQEEIADRRPAAQIRLRGVVKQTTPEPSPAAVAPYRRALVLHHVRVEQVVSGRLTASDILLARWGLLDGRKVGGAVPAVDETIDLLVEPLLDHPELESERQLIEVDEFDLPAYYDVGQLLEQLD